MGVKRGVVEMDGVCLNLKVIARFRFRFYVANIA